MANKRLHILIAEPSLILRRGLQSVLADIDSIGVDVTDIEDVSLLGDAISNYKPDAVVVNPIHLGITPPQEFSKKGQRVVFIALQNYILSSELYKGYDFIISVLDNTSVIEQTLNKLANEQDAPKDEELSIREKEVVKAIALGKSNKEIADTLCISVHTVMTHRKNIATKLKIHNSAGLTIYAIVNKLIDVNEV